MVAPYHASLQEKSDSSQSYCTPNRQNLTRSCKTVCNTVLALKNMSGPSRAENYFTRILLSVNTSVPMLHLGYSHTVSSWKNTDMFYQETKSVLLTLDFSLAVLILIVGQVAEIMKNKVKTPRPGGDTL